MTHPTLLKIASWNVNSLPVRTSQLLHWMTENHIDVLAVQETKVTDDKFPHQEYAEHPFHIVNTGQKSYNGVALISKLPLTDVYIEPLDTKERRIIAATVQDIRIINLYVPNGSTLSSDKYSYKLQWLEHVTDFIQKQQQQYPKLMVVGDFNIAPQDIDVHDPKAWVGSVLVSPKEREALSKLQQLGLQDSFRCLYPDRQEYSWWDYRAASFQRNRGLRIDLMLLSDALMPSCQDAGIDPTPRKNERPSDHTPVWVSIAPLSPQS